MLKRKEGEVGHSRFDMCNGPSDKWFQSFEKRHPYLSWSVPQTIDKHRADAADERKIDSFFNLLGKATMLYFFQIDFVGSLMSLSKYCTCQLKTGYSIAHC